MFAIDVSGSMGGHPIEDAKAAVLSLIKKFRKLNIPITVYPFQSVIYKFSSDEIGYDQVYEKVQGLRAGGGNDFAAVLAAYHKQIQENQYPNVFIVWLSDGCLTGEPEPRKLIPGFQQMCETNGISCAVHSIGFGPNHDAQMLQAFSTSGSRTGTFQYVESGGRIPIAVNNVYQLAFENAAWARFIARGGQFSQRVTLEESQDQQYYTAQLYISEEDMEDTIIEFHNRKQIIKYQLQLQRAEPRDLRELILNVTSFVSSKIKHCLSEGSTTKLARLNQLKEQMAEFKRRLTDIQQSLVTGRVIQRKQLQVFLSAGLELIQIFEQVTASQRNGEISNTELASLIDLADKIKMKQSLEKKIIQQTGQNFANLQRYEAEIEEIANRAREEGLEGESRFVCELSGKDWQTVVKEGDCLCLTFNLEKPKGGVVDPNQFNMKKVNGYVLAAEAFMGSKLFYGKVGMIIEGNSRFVQDAEPESTNQLEPTLPDSVVTGVLPLYINEKHWEIARRRLEPLLGWTVVVDILAYDTQQALVIPFKVLAQTFAEYGITSELFLQVRNTCLQIYRENIQEILPQLQDIIQQYNEDPRARMRSSIRDNLLFLMQIYMAALNGDVDDKAKTLFPRIFEEEVRRLLKPVANKRHFVIKMLGIDTDEFTRDIKLDDLYDELRQAAAGNLVQRKEDVYQYTETIDSLEDAPAVLLDYIHDEMAGDSHLAQVVKAFELMDERPYRYVTDSGLIYSEQILGLIIQSSLQQTDEERINAVEQGKFVDLFSEESAINYIQSLYTETVRQEIKAFKSKAMQNLTNIKEENALQFAMADNLEAAAELIQGIKQGSPMFISYVKKLALPGIPYACEKLKMLTTGQYQGRKLIFDKFKSNPEFVTWHVTKSLLYKIWTLYRDQASLEQWKTAAPGREEYLEAQE